MIHTTHSSLLTLIYFTIWAILSLFDAFDASQNRLMWRKWLAYLVWVHLVKGSIPFIQDIDARFTTLLNIDVDMKAIQLQAERLVLFGLNC